MLDIAACWAVSLSYLELYAIMLPLSFIAYDNHFLNMLSSLSSVSKTVFSELGWRLVNMPVMLQANLNWLVCSREKKVFNMAVSY